MILEKIKDILIDEPIMFEGFMLWLGDQVGDIKVVYDNKNECYIIFNETMTDYFVVDE